MSSAMSYRVALTFLSPFRRTLPIDCKFRILDLDGDAKIILCKFLMLMPVEKVPYEATIIALLSFSVIARTFSRSSVSTPPWIKKTLRLSIFLLFIISYNGCPCASTLAKSMRVLPLRSNARLRMKRFLFSWPIIYCTSSSNVSNLFGECFNNNTFISNVARCPFFINSSVLIIL